MTCRGRATDVVGRHTELAAVSQLLDTVPAGVAGLLLEGDAGAGKTTLWRAGVEAARARGHRVLACRPAEAEARLSFAAMADLLEPVLADALPGLPPPQRHGLETALLRAEADTPADERAVASGVLSVLRSAARSVPVLVAVDDWQWLDTASAQVLRCALRQLGNEPVGMLATVRTGAGVGGVLARDLGDSRFTVLGLGPLTLAALHQLVTARVGVSLSRRALLKIHHAAAGNMVFALEIARVLAARAEPLPPGAAVPVPAALGELVGQRLSELPASTRDVLLGASALTQPTVGLLKAVDARWRPEAVLAAAERAELVVLEGGRVRFAHPLIATAVYANATPERRQRLHRRLAQVVTGPEERARHLASAAAGPSRAVADALERAAASARLRGAADAAAELCELAADATPPDQQETRRRRLFDAAEHLFVAGDRRGARRLLAQILEERTPGPERARALRLLAEVRYDDDFPEAGQLLRMALPEAGDDAAERAAIHLDLAYVARAGTREPMGGGHVRAALAAAEEHGGQGLLAVALSSETMDEFLHGRGLDEARLQRALALEDIIWRTPAPMRPSAVHGALMSWTGRPLEAQASLEGIRARLVEQGDEAALPFLAFLLAPAACVRGDLAAAERHGAEGLEAAARVGSDLPRAYALTAAAHVDAYAGRIGCAVTRAGQAIELFEKVGCHGWVAWPLSVLGFAHLSVDDAAATAGVLRPELQALPTGPIQEPTAVPFVPDAVQSLIMLGDLDTAESVLAWFERRGRSLDRPWVLATGRRCRGLLRAQHGDLVGALAALDEALGIHQRLPHPVERARTLLVLGQLQRRANQRRNARATLERARVIFDGVGAVQWARRVDAELGRLGLHRRAGGGLTPRELQVAEKAATGATNNQIAAALCISPKTVEANLSRVYTKLGISSRAELGAWTVAERGAQEPPPRNSPTTPSMLATLSTSARGIATAARRVSEYGPSGERQDLRTF